jgi:two-component system, LytTR family, response regulator
MEQVIQQVMQEAEEVQELQQTQEDNYKLVLPTLKKTYSFSPEEIIRLEAKSNYTRIYFSNHHPLIMSKVLKDYEAILEPYGFVRTHRSHLVNKNLISEVGKGKIIMNDMSIAEISRRKKSGVMKALQA